MFDPHVIVNSTVGEKYQNQRNQRMKLKNRRGNTAEPSVQAISLPFVTEKEENEV